MHHQKATRTALIPQEVSHSSPHWGGGCASSRSVEKSVGTAGVRRLETQVPRGKWSLKISFSGDVLVIKLQQVFVGKPASGHVSEDI